MVIWHSILLQMLLHEMYIAPCYKKDLRKTDIKALFQSSGTFHTRKKNELQIAIVDRSSSIT